MYQKTYWIYWKDARGPGETNWPTDQTDHSEILQCFTKDHPDREVTGIREEAVIGRMERERAFPCDGPIDYQTRCIE